MWLHETIIIVECGVEWRSGNIPDLSPGWAELGSNLGRMLAACGAGKSLCVRPVYGLWCAHSFNKCSPSVLQR